MSAEPASAELPRYRCHKEVWALKIGGLDFLTSSLGLRIVPEDKRYAPFDVDAEYVTKHQPRVGGYYVVYKDGYKSFSPAEAFEDGYTLIQQRKPTIDELEAILNSDADRAITILPNGEIRSEPGSGGEKPLTMRENLGGEYGGAVAMGVTHRPSMSLRFVRRMQPLAEPPRAVMILQQLFVPKDWKTHDEEWRDVLVAEGV